MAIPFQYRSTNTIGYTHFGGAMVIGVEHGGGVEINPVTSTTAAPNITAAGDEANKGLTIQSKGTGTLTLGSTGAAMVLNSTTAQIGSASTTPIAMIQRYFVQFTVPALSSASSAESTVTVTGLTTNSILVLQNRLKLNSTVTGVTVTPRCSTADELTIEFHNISQSSLSGSTQSGYLLQFSF